MDLNTARFIVLLIDFDSDARRLETARSRIPERLQSRVFILGAWSEPEDLTRAGLGLYEAIGSAMAKDCREETDAIWGHDLLVHNAGELARLRGQVRPILF
jgi:hypothetical protein